MLIAVIVLGSILVIAVLAIAVHLDRIADAVEAQNKTYGIGMPTHVTAPVPGPEQT